MVPPTQITGGAIIEEYRNILKSEEEVSIGLKAERDKKSEPKKDDRKGSDSAAPLTLSVSDSNDRE